MWKLPKKGWIIKAELGETWLPIFKGEGGSGSKRGQACEMVLVSENLTCHAPPVQLDNTSLFPGARTLLTPYSAWGQKREDPCPSHGKQHACHPEAGGRLPSQLLSLPLELLQQAFNLFERPDWVVMSICVLFQCVEEHSGEAHCGRPLLLGSAHMSCT